MDRSYLANASQTPPEAPPSSGGYPTAGSKVTGTPATTPGAYWFHMITEEIRNCVVSSGQEPDASDLTQLYKSFMMLAHPVGSIYQSTDPTSPAKLFGGTWVAIKDRMLIGAGNEFGVLTEGGAATHTLTANEMPSHTHSASTSSAGAHTHTRGTMNITGRFQYGDNGSDNTEGTGAEGAFYESERMFRGSYGHGKGTGLRFGFDASRSWTGATSSSGAHSHGVTVSAAGGGKAFDTMSPYLAVFMWRRTA